MAMKALVMGFGGTGTQILTKLKELTFLKLGQPPLTTQFIVFDTIADWAPGKTVSILGGAAQEVVARGEEISLDPQTEYFPLLDRDPDLGKHVYELLTSSGTPERYPHLKDWLHVPWFVQIARARLSIAEGAAQQRQIGRFAMFQNADRIVQKIHDVIRNLWQPGGAPVNVWIVGSSAGGTGAGCLIDAAYLTRQAQGEADINLTGVIILPDVYTGSEGVSQARAYSLFRELERVQNIGLKDYDYYDTGKRGRIASKVDYDAQGHLVAFTRSKLFDDLFYVGKSCRSDPERGNFFISVANAIDPYLDETSGPTLLQLAINQESSASAFGASRLYVPVETYAGVFAWEQVLEFLRKAAAPEERDGTVTALRAGTPRDREDGGDTKVRRLLALFGNLLDRAGSARHENEAYGRNTLTAERIIGEWYRFDGAAIAGIDCTPQQRETIALTYINPYISMMEPDEAKVPREQWITKTYNENAKVGGVKETQQQSRDRFAAKLDEVTGRYKTSAGGEGTFEKGRQFVRQMMTEQLASKIDSMVIEEIAQNQTFGCMPGQPDQGTVLTRLYTELRHMISSAGPFWKIDETIGQLLGALDSQEAILEQQPVEALKTLKISQKPGLLSFGNWVEVHQQRAREECAEYIRWYQKRALLKDMQQLVRSARERVQAWAELLHAVFEKLVLAEPRSAFFEVNRKKLEGGLYKRLQRLASSSTARISCQPGDADMQGYRTELRRHSVYVSGDRTLSDEVLDGCRWEAQLRNGQPALELHVAPLRTKYSRDDIPQLADHLYVYFKGRISDILKTRDIFDYLRWAAQNREVTARAVAQLLNSDAAALINARGREECRLVYREPADREKRELANDIHGQLREINSATTDPETNHSDPNSITLMKVLKPDIHDINDLVTCRGQYEEWQTARTNGKAEHDNEVRRAQVHHPFRAELEARFIEHRHCLRNEVQARDVHMPPRVVRLLDDPAMMQGFVHCVATGAVSRVQGEGWRWSNLARKQTVVLTDWEEDPTADVLRAAVVFVLQKTEGRRGGLTEIRLEDVKTSAIQQAQQAQKSRDEMVAEFCRTKLDDFLSAHLREDTDAQVRRALKMVFEFYGDPTIRTGLQQRLD